MARKYGEIGRKIIPHWKANSIIVLNGFGHIQKKAAQKQSYGLDDASGKRIFIDGGSGDLTHYYKVEFLNQ